MQADQWNVNFIFLFWKIIIGPFKVNGVPLRRVNQAYVIATSTSVDISKVNIPENINDAYFKKPAQAKKSGKFFAEGEKVKI